MVKDEARQMQGERSELQDALQAAQEVLLAGRERLRKLLSEARSLSSSYRARFRSVSTRLAAASGQLSQAEEEALGDPALADGSPSVLLIELREEFQSLRQQQAWLAEKVLEAESVQRRLKAAIKQVEVGASCLSRDIDETDQSPEGEVQPWRLQVLQAQEDERLRLAREVHDGPAQVLANAIFELEYCERLLDKDPAKLKTELARLKRDIREGLADVRYFIFGLRPAPLADLGLQATLRRYAEDYQTRFGISVRLVLDEIPRLSSTYEVAIFRIIQEALQNTQKHSAAKSVLVELRNQEDGLVVAVHDDGLGFDTTRELELEGKRFGLVSMRERARLVGGELEISSEPGKGTRVQLTVPSAALRVCSGGDESEKGGGQREWSE